MSEQRERLRQHPEERFHPPQLQFDLEELVSQLQREPLAPNRRHRQETLYRHGPLTIALFLFEQGASLPQHAAEGVVTVQVIQGRLKVIAQEEEHDLPAGSLLVLAPGVRHDVQAIEPTRMLLTVCLNHQQADTEMRS
jgi:quercetin dioxygenase-like cupin family protein